MADKISERGQISGMAIVLSAPDAGNIHAVSSITGQYLD
jgi:hypothetical protein